MIQYHNPAPRANVVGDWRANPYLCGMTDVDPNTTESTIDIVNDDDDVNIDDCPF